MKKLIFLILLSTIGLLAFNQTITSPQVISYQADPEAIVIDTLSSALGDTIWLEIKRANTGSNLCFSANSYATQVSGTSEVWVHYYGSNALSYTSLVSLAAEDTLKSGQFSHVETDTDGFDYRYMCIIYIAKTATQSTALWNNIYVWKRP